MSSTEELAALAALTFNWTRTLNDVWVPARFHVDGLHAEAAADIAQAVAEADTADANPLGLVIQGQRGSGKTHLLGWTRERVEQAGGYFFLVGDLSAKAFWEELLGCVVEQLLPLPDGSRDQLKVLLTALADRLGLDPVLRAAVTGQQPPTPEALRSFISALRRTDQRIGLTCQDTARALVLLASPDQADQDVGYYFMTGNEVAFEDRRHWGINATRSIPRLLITELSRLLALTGPTVIAIDQVDALIDELVGQPADGAPRSRALADMATGLMTLRDRSFRTLTIVSCLPESWAAIRTYGTDAVADRFRPPRQLRNIPSADIGRLMIEKRFRADYTRAGFEPPYATWPILPSAFRDASRYTARALLKRVEQHVDGCLRARAVTQLRRLEDDGDEGLDVAAAGRDAGEPAGPQETQQPDRTDGADDLAELDARFAELRGAAAIAAAAAAALTPETEDTAMPALLGTGLEAWVRERGSGDDPFAQDPPPGKNPRLHASLRQVLDPRTERHRRWAFRAIAASNPSAVQSRLRKATEASGLDAGRPDRHLFVLRNAPWPNGKVTEREAAGLTAKGGVVLPAAPDDLAVFAAIAVLMVEHHPALNTWLASRRPAHATRLFTAAFAELADPPGPAEQPNPAEQPSPADQPVAARPPVPADQPTPASPPSQAPQSAQSPQFPQFPPSPAAGPPAAAQEPGARHSGAGEGQAVPPSIRLGLATGNDGDDGASATLPLASLRRHAAVIAGSGSGQTVLLRRVIEECALHGVSSIVLDPGNELARLGEAWPAPPERWLPGDAGRAAAYLAETDVVVWTPRRAGGRPLTFQPLPDFGAVIDDVDEFNAAVDAAVEALAPRVSGPRAGQRASQEKAVLTEAMRFFGRGAGRDLSTFIGLLGNLPGHVSGQAKGTQIAADLADRLRAVRATDPLFGGDGEPADPAVLLTPPPGKRARVSVISMVGMAGLDQWQGFVSQLQMALFSWIKRNPAGSEPLRALLVMDQAQDLVPSSGSTACSESTRRLAAQARKYGLGLLFATQSPRALHDSVPGNAATQFFGLLNAPAQIDAARELARAKGGEIPGVGRLSAGEFYLAAEGGGFQRIATPMCLSHHPASPLTEDEVVALAAEKARACPAN